jgi:F-type H+-transporting ATPase subunit delta
MKSTRQLKREARTLFHLCVVNGALDESRVREIVRRVVEEKRRGSLTTLSRFQRLVRLDRASHSAHVESAVSLRSDVRAQIETGLARLHGRGITTTFTENPALLGGVCIQVGSDVYDGSIRARLNAVETRV